MKLSELNTHAVAIGGIVAIIIGLFTDPSTQAALMSLAGLFNGGPVNWGGVAIATLVLLGAIGAYLGRPHNIA